MDQNKMGLFREEVLAQRSDSLYGTVNLAVPIGWQIVGAFLAIITAAIILFLASTSYSRTVSASGLIIPAGGLIQIVPSRVGRLEHLDVVEGQNVQKGQRLAVIGAEQTDSSGDATQTSILRAIKSQEFGLIQERSLSIAAAEAEQQQYDAQIAGLREQEHELTSQTSVQRRLVDLAQADLDRVSQIASHGFISRHDIAQREETLLLRQQQLYALRETQSEKRSGIMQASRARQQAAAKAAGEGAALVSSEAQIERDRIMTNNEKGLAVLAPQSGQVSALNLHVGDSVDERSSIMTVIAANGAMYAEIHVPGNAIGFIEKGDKVRLALEAYPFDRFGTLNGEIRNISAAPQSVTSANKVDHSFYVATASIDREYIKAYGRKQRILPGMAFTVRIVVDHRSLIQWLFDPLLAAAK